MQLGIFAKTFSGTEPFAVLAAARDAGFRTVQYNMACSGLAPLPEAIPAGTAEAVASASRETGVGIAAVSATYNMIHPDPAVRRRGQASLALICEAARTMGTRLVTLCTGTRDPHDQWRGHPDNNTPEAWRDLLAGLEAAIAIAEASDVDLGIEPEQANVVDSAAKAERLIVELGSPRLRIVLDPANLIGAAEEQHCIVDNAVSRLAGRLAMAHAKDRAANGRVVAAGSGVIDFSHFLHRLASVGFDGPLVTHGLDAADAPNVHRFLARTLAEAKT